MTIFFTIKTKFFRIKTISFTIKTISLQSCHIDSSTPKWRRRRQTIIETRRDVSLHAGRLEHDTRMSEMDGRLDDAGRSVVTLRPTNTRRKRHETNMIDSVSIGRETVDRIKDTVPRTEEPEETLEFLSDPNRTNDSIGQLVVLLADPTYQPGRRMSELKTLVRFIDDFIDPPFHLSFARITDSVKPFENPKTGLNDSAHGVGIRRGVMSSRIKFSIYAGCRDI